MMLGYSIHQKAYKLWDLNKGEVTASRDVVFDESKAAYTSQDCRSEVEIDDGDDYNQYEEKIALQVNQVTRKSTRTSKTQQR